MHKNALFLLKNCKNRPALGASPPDFLYLRCLGALPHDPQPPAAGGFAPRPQMASSGWGRAPATHGVKCIGRKIAGGGATEKTKSKNSTIKPLSILSVTYMKIQGGRAPHLPPPPLPPAAHAHVWCMFAQS